jgi:hypothetical protein
MRSRWSTRAGQSRHASFILSGMRAQLTLPDPSLEAVRFDLDMILVFGALHGQKARDCCHRRVTNNTNLACVGRKYHHLADSEFMAHRRWGYQPTLRLTADVLP